MEESKKILSYMSIEYIKMRALAIFEDKKKFS